MKSRKLPRIPLLVYAIVLLVVFNSLCNCTIRVQIHQDPVPQLPIPNNLAIRCIYCGGENECFCTIPVEQTPFDNSPKLDTIKRRVFGIYDRSVYVPKDALYPVNRATPKDTIATPCNCNSAYSCTALACLGENNKCNTCTCFSCGKQWKQ